MIIITLLKIFVIQGGISHIRAPVLPSEARDDGGVGQLLVESHQAQGLPAH